MNEIAETLDAVRDDLLIARVALEREDQGEVVIERLQSASGRLRKVVGQLRNEGLGAVA